MKPTVYIETSVISYLTAYMSRDLVVAAHQQLTQDWWKQALPQLEAYISSVVLEEISQGDSDAAARRTKVVGSFGILEVVPEVKELADLYFTAIDISEKARADSYHLALSVYHGMDYLVTWNCTHIAGGKVKRIIDVVNSKRGVNTPVICTPEELMEV